MTKVIVQTRQPSRAGSSTLSLSRLPHLMGFRSRFPGGGLCVHRSTALCLDLKGSEIVIAVFRGATLSESILDPRASKTPFIHCWVEHQDRVLSPTLMKPGDQSVPSIDPDFYYIENGASNFHRLSRRELLIATAGSWVSSYFKYGKPLKGRKPLASMVLDASGIEYRVEDGWLMPL